MSEPEKYKKNGPLPVCDCTDCTDCKIERLHKIAIEKGYKGVLVMGGPK